MPPSVLFYLILSGHPIKRTPAFCGPGLDPSADAEALTLNASPARGLHLFGLHALARWCRLPIVNSNERVTERWWSHVVLSDDVTEHYGSHHAGDSRRSAP
jgi:hypothetical protein